MADIATVQTLQAAGIEAESATIAVMDYVLGTYLSTERAALLAELDIALRNRSHPFNLTSLPADTQYEYEIRSISLAGRFSSVESGLFRTRRLPDLRVAVGTDLDIQSTPSPATATWFTNRSADTRFDVALPDEDFSEDVAVFDGTADGAAAAFDLDGDGTVSFGDFFSFTDSFGKSAAGKRWAASG